MYTSHSSHVAASETARQSANKTLYDYDICHSDTWINAVNGNTSSIMFNTEMFLENITYALRLTISKGSRTSNFTQTITINPGAAPVVEIE